MILFQEQFFDLEDHGYDNLPDSAYFAHLSRPSSGGGAGGSIDSATIDQITQTVINEAGDQITNNVINQVENTIETTVETKIEEAVGSATAITEIETEITNIQGDITTLNTTLSELAEVVETISTAITTIQTTITDLTERIEALEAKRPHIHLTPAEYDALSEEEKMKDIEYFVS